MNTNLPEQQSLRVICLQTRLTQYHYQSYSILRDSLLERIHRASNPSRSPTLIVLPECTGTWLYLMCVPMPQFLRNYLFNDRHLLFIAYTLFTHVPSFGKELYRNYRRTSTWSGWIQRSWFTLFSRRTHDIYRELFRELACESGCTIVAGSTFAADDEQHLYNLSSVFEPVHGSICLQSGKRYPAQEEHSFLDCYQERPRIYSIPNTNVDIGVLVCADSWMPETYEEYHRLALDRERRRRFLFIIVALNIGRWDIPWPGYGTHFALPADVNQKHLQTYSLGKAWFRYAVNRAFESFSRRQDLLGYGVVCCQGILNLMNDIEAEGESVLLIQRSDTEAKLLYEAKTFREETILSCEF
jgi:hypothetical protein